MIDVNQLAGDVMDRGIAPTGGRPLGMARAGVGQVGRVPGEPGEEFLGAGPVDGLAGRGLEGCALPGVDTDSTPVAMPWLSMNLSAAGRDQSGRSMPPGRMPLSRSKPA
jgi:hypothetical protein